MNTEKIINLLNHYQKTRPEPNRNLDQFLADNSTIVKRAKLLADIEDIENKSVLFLGDDDLGSISLRSIVKPKKITVIDIDQNLLNFISTVSSNEKLDVDCFYHDLRHPLPKNLLNNYDIIFFDPPYTPNAVNDWLNRAIEASLGTGINNERKSTKNLLPKKYFLCFGYSDFSNERGLKIQDILSKLGFVIRNKFRDFNKYNEAKSIGSKSDLYELDLTPKVNIKNLDIARSKFYTGKKVFNN